MMSLGAYSFQKPLHIFILIVYMALQREGASFSSPKRLPQYERPAWPRARGTGVKRRRYYIL